MSASHTPIVMQVVATNWLMTDPPRPCPDVLTDEEAVIYLRLDSKGRTRAQALKSLEWYRSEGKIKGTRVGKWFVYRRADLEEFLHAQTS